MTEPAPSRPRIFVAGSGPIPPERPGRLCAPGIRVWGIARELARAGHPVRLATVEYRGRPLEEVRVRDLESPEAASAPPEARTIQIGAEPLPAIFARLAEEFGAAAAVGSCEMANRELARMEGGLPLWCDCFGDPMAERQMLAWLHETDDLLADQWATYAPILRRADRMSGCSRFQSWAIVGQMGAVGRLNRWTAGETLVHVIRPWIEPIEPDAESETLVRGVAAPRDAVIALQTGGFNTWLDPDTLFAALSLAMQENPRLHFAATGGALKGHDERTFERFRSRVEASPLRSRFHMLGWLPLGQVPRVIAECDVGLNVDRPCPEGWLGTRNRLLDWLLGGLAVVSTAGCELAEELAGAGLIETAPQTDPEAVAGAIERALAGGEEGREARRARAKAYLDRHHAPGVCLAPLLDWAARPRRASDLRAWEAGTAAPPTLWRSEANRAGAAGELDSARLRGEESHRRIAELEGSRLIRAANWLRGLRRR